MRKNTNILLAILGFLMLFLSPSVQAASRCDTTKVAELNREVTNIKVNYEIAEKMYELEEVSPPDSWYPENEGDLPTYKYFKINILNLTEDFYVEIPEISNTDENYTYDMATNGTLTIDFEDTSIVRVLTFKIYSSDKTGCEGELFRTVYLTLPRYNDYSEYSICKQVPDYYLCQPFVTFQDVDFATFSRYIDSQISKIDKEYIEKLKEEEQENGKKNFLKKYWYIFVVVGVLAVGGITTAVIAKRRESGGNEI